MDQGQTGAIRKHPRPIVKVWRESLASSDQRGYRLPNQCSTDFKTLPPHIFISAHSNFREYRSKNSVPEEAPKCIRRKRREFQESYRRCHCPIASTSGGANKRAHYEKTPA
ncbi:hypothetical protein CDAR_278871 [Caerostris darwini]|uniref:Uncharacterized protein n=1 Tax=Caerostris darwini TaxID=1538125 RepID=A0AAV4WNF9_9ARAC|nr:hypothetical protein CDAR_278871 [Caerostris darwini]